MFIATGGGVNLDKTAYVVDCNLTGKVNLKITLIMKLRMKVSLYFTVHPCSGSLAVLLQFCHLDCIFHACIYFCSVLWEKLS